MTSILRDWLSSKNVTFQTNAQLENVFANGYQLGKLILNLELGGITEQVFTHEFADTEAIEVS